MTNEEIEKTVNDITAETDPTVKHPSSQVADELGKPNPYNS